jgi:hypothetical protein
MARIRLDQPLPDAAQNVPHIGAAEERYTMTIADKAVLPTGVARSGEDVL